MLNNTVMPNHRLPGSSMLSTYVQDQKLNICMLVYALPQGQKQISGGQLFPLIETMDLIFTSEITGIETEYSELYMLDSPELPF